jgi:flagellar motor protein MotB
VTTVFVSYRRAQSSDVTGRICDHLIRRLGDDNVFRDVDKIAGGANFRRIVREEVARRDALLVVIDPHWLDLRNKSGTRRLEDPNDPVRIEIETALGAGKLLIPLLVGGAAMPEEEALPDSLKPLAEHNAIAIRPDPDFRNDIERLVRALRRPGPPPGGASRRLAAAGLAVAASLALYASGLAEHLLPGSAEDPSASGAAALAGTDLSIVRAKRERFASALRHQFGAEIASGQVGYTADLQTLQIRFNQNVLFNPGEYTLRPSARRLLDRLAVLARSLEERGTPIYEQIQIEGHTDDLPVPARNAYPRDNWELSTARATSVLRYLTDGARPPLDGTRMSVSGYADSRPVSRQRSLNRRIEIRVYFSGKDDRVNAAP